MAGTRQELEAAVFDLAARVASVRAALSAAITNDVDEADRLDVLEGAYRVLGDAMDSMWTAWERFDQGEMRERAAPEGTAPLLAPGLRYVETPWREADEHEREGVAVPVTSGRAASR
jgi:hypothetical protein